MFLKRNLAISLFVSSALLFSASSFAAADMFLNISGVMGESTYPGHEDEIDVLAWSWGASSEFEGKKVACNIQDLLVTKYVDASSPDLLMAQLTGGTFETAILVVRKAGADPLEYINIEFNDVRVSSVSTGGSGEEDRITENVTLNFSSATYTYTRQNRDGSAGLQEMAYISGC